MMSQLTERSGRILFFSWEKRPLILWAFDLHRMLTEIVQRKIVNCMEIFGIPVSVFFWLC